MATDVMAKLSGENMKTDIPEFRVGDTVRVHVNIREMDKERVQAYEGIVIARGGRGATATYTVRRISHGVGVERVFPVHSPYVAKIEVVRQSRVRRAKLYFLRDRVGKRARLREKARV